MTSVVNSYWISAISGAYNSAPLWTPSTIPTYGGGNEYDVFIGGPFTSGLNAFTVTSSVNEQVGFLDIGANASLQIGGGAFFVISRVYSYSNAYNYGTIGVAAGSALAFGAAGVTASTVFQNLGTLSVAGSLRVASSWFGLYGAGVLTLSGNIVGANTGSYVNFVNRGSTIQGSGLIGTGATLFLTNGFGGLINANAASALKIVTGANWIYNEGTIETTGAGGLQIYSNMQLDGQLKAAGAGALKLVGSYVRGGGAAVVDAGATLVLANSQLDIGGYASIAKGGRLLTSTGDTTRIGSNNAFAGDALSLFEIDNDGTIQVLDNSTLNMSGAVYGAGAIVLGGATHKTTLEVFRGGLTLNNASGVVMTNSAQNAIVSNGSAVALVNNAKISGAGSIGDGWLRLVNNQGASILANGGVALSIVGDSSAMTAGGAANSNSGTILNAGPGGLLISGALTNAGSLIENGDGALTLAGARIDGGGGVIKALKGKILLQNDAFIANQAAVSIAAGATMTSGVSSPAGNTIDVNVQNQGVIELPLGGTLNVGGYWTNNGEIGLATMGGSAVKVKAGGLWVLQGAGTLKIYGGDQIVSGGANARLVNRSNIISGAGTIGDSNMEFDVTAGGKVVANANASLTLNARAQDPVTGQAYLYNSGVLQSDSASGLILNAGAYSPGQIVVNNGGRFVANQSVYGRGSTTINGTGTAEFLGALDNDVHFGAAGGDLILDSSHQFYGAIFGFAAGDTIDLRDFAFVAGSTGVDPATSTFGALDGALYATNGMTDSTGLFLEGDYSAATLATNHLAFQFAADGQTIGGTSSQGTLVKLVATA